MLFLRTKKILLRISIVCIALVVSLLFGEMIIRILYSNLPAGNHHKLFVEYDPVLGWKKIPNMTGKHMTREYSVVEKINSKSIRGPEYAYKKNHDEYRILILGDSFAEGYTVEFDEVFSEVLKKILNNNHTQKADYRRTNTKYYQTINTGTGGYSTDQELLLFQSKGKKYSPDLTILMFCENDIWYNNQDKYWRGYKPLFQLVNNKLRLTNVPLPRPKFDLEEWFYRTSRLYEYANERLPSLRAFIISKINSYFGSKNKPIMPEEFFVYRKEPTATVSMAWKITNALIAKLKEETAQSGNELVVFYIPPQQMIYPAYGDRIKKLYRISDADWDIYQVRNKIQEICKNNGIPFIDPVASFMEAAKGTESAPLYCKLEDHWNSAGHKLVGKILAQYILAKNQSSSSK